MYLCHIIPLVVGEDLMKGSIKIVLFRIGLKDVGAI
jgi:hypothetical protein